MFWAFGHEAYGIFAPWPGIEPELPALESKVSTTGMPGTSLESFFFLKKEKRQIENFSGCTAVAGI